FNSNPQGVTSISVATPLPTATISTDAIGPENAQKLSQVNILDKNSGQEMHFSLDGHRLLALQSDVLRAWDMPAGTVFKELSIQTEYYAPFALSPDGETVVIGNYPSEGHLQFWSLSSAQMLREFEGGEQIRHLSFNPTGESLAVGRGDGSVEVLDVNSGAVV